ncbi:hypothetical protein D3C86_1448330 [compost metagenome]
MAAGLLQVRQRSLAAQQYGAGVDLVHQVKTLEFEVLNPGELDRPGIVDQCIDATEMFVGLGQGLMHGIFIAHIHLQGQCLAACGFDFLGHAENRARQLGVGGGAFGGDHNVGPVACGPQRDLATNAAAGAGDEQGFALQ